MSVRRELVFCDDCPIRHYCDVEENKCDAARWIDKQARDAPPLSPQQIRTVVTLLRG